MSVFFTLCPSTINNALEALRPQSLRHSSASAKKQELDFMKFKVANRATCEFADSANLTDHRFHPNRRQHGTTSSTQRLAVTRAEESVVFVLDDQGESKLRH